MKKYLLIFSFVCFLIPLKSLAQRIRVPNSSFEIWDSLASLTVPDSWPSSDLLWYYNGYNTHNVYPDRHCHSGKYSAKIKPDTAAGKLWPGFIVAKLGIKRLPAYFSFYYVDSLSQSESAAIKIDLFRWNSSKKTEDSVGETSWNFPGTVAKNFTYGEIPIDYSTIDTTTKPDSISITIEVVGAPGALPSGFIVVDDVGLGTDTSGIEIFHPINDFELYPNPTNAITYIVSTGLKGMMSKVEITDLNGKMIYAKYEDIGTQSPIDLTDNPPGIYFVRVISEDKISVNKIILSR